MQEPQIINTSHKSSIKAPICILSETDNLFKAYSVQEIASMLGIGKTKTRELLDSGILPVTKVGRQYFTSPASIQEFLKKNIGKQIFF